MVDFKDPKLNQPAVEGESDPHGKIVSQDPMMKKWTIKETEKRVAEVNWFRSDRFFCPPPPHTYLFDKCFSYKF